MKKLFESMVDASQSINISERDLARICATPLDASEKTAKTPPVGVHPLERASVNGFVKDLGEFRWREPMSQSRFAWSTNADIVKTACYRAFQHTKRRVVRISANNVIEFVKGFDDKTMAQPRFRDVIYYVVLDKKPTMTSEGFVSMFDQFLDRAKAEDGIVYLNALAADSYVTNHLTLLKEKMKIDF